MLDKLSNYGEFGWPVYVRTGFFLVKKRTVTII